jgi:hypothetical protein
LKERKGFRSSRNATCSKCHAAPTGSSGSELTGKLGKDKGQGIGVGPKILRGTWAVEMAWKCLGGSDLKVSYQGKIDARLLGSLSRSFGLFTCVGIEEYELWLLKMFLNWFL